MKSLMSECLEISADDIALPVKDQEFSWMSTLNPATLQVLQESEETFLAKMEQEVLTEGNPVVCSESVDIFKVHHLRAVH